MTREENYMLEAVKLAKYGMDNNEGGPFGCVIVKDNKIIGRGNNKVIANTDPTAHAEIVAIRNACKNLNHFQLTDCEIFTTCEPCPMCLGAIYWARPKAIYFGNTKENAASIGFDDSMIYEEISTEILKRKIPTIHINNLKALELFEIWKSKSDKHTY